MSGDNTKGNCYNGRELDAREFQGKSMIPALQVGMRLEPHIEGHLHLLEGFGYSLDQRGVHKSPGTRRQSGESTEIKKQLIVSWI